jgi:hypothetical protein
VSREPARVAASPASAPAWSAVGPFERRTPADAGAVRYQRADGGEWAAEADAPTHWPARVQHIHVERPAAAGPSQAKLGGPDGELRVALRRWSAHEPARGLYDPSLAGFAPSDRERRIVRWLLRLLRVPGATRLLRAWHASRSG